MAGKRTTSRTVAKTPPKALSIPKAKREKYLELVATGTPLPEAARAIGATGRLMRSLAHNDPGFAEARADAIAEAKQAHAEQYVPELRAARRKLAIEELDGRMLHYESIANDPDYRAAHTRTQVEHVGPQGGPVEVKIDVTFPQLREQLERRAALDGTGVAALPPVVDVSRAGGAEGRDP